MLEIYNSYLVLKKLSLNKAYSGFSNFENLLNHKEDLSFKISFYKLIDYLLKEIKKNVVKKRSKLNIEKADFTKFTENEILILSNISKEMKDDYLQNLTEEEAGLLSDLLDKIR